MGVDIHFGAQESELSRAVDLQWWFGAGLFQSMWPKSMGRKIACSFWDIMKTMKAMKPIPGRGALIICQIEACLEVIYHM